MPGSTTPMRDETSLMSSPLGISIVFASSYPKLAISKNKEQELPIVNKREINGTWKKMGMRG